MSSYGFNSSAMKQVNVTEFRSHLFDYLNNLSDQPLELVLRGEVVARLLPPSDSQIEALALLKELRKRVALSKEPDLDNLLKPSDWSVDSDDSIGY